MPGHRLRTRQSALAALCLLVALGLIWPQLAIATPDTTQVGDPCLTDALCSELVASARALSKGQKHADALAAYQTAYGRRPVPWLLLNIGRVQHKLGRYDEAIGSYRAFLKQTPPGANDELRRKAEEYGRAAESEQRHIAPAQHQEPAEIPAEPPNPGSEQRPIYKRWWFWAALGVATLGVTLGAGLGGYATRPNLGNAPVLVPFKQ